MTIKASGSSLSFTEIAAEFGNPTGNKFGSYRVSKNIGSLTGLPLDSGIPKTDAISFSDFYSKELNIVVVCTSGNRATANYNTGVTVGGFKSRPAKNATGWQGGKRVFINITGTYSSNGASSSEWAFRTGNSWPAGTEMSVVVGSGGEVVGRGGNGGSPSGGDGSNGSNGLRIWSGYETYQNAGYVSAGGGGGGGGSDAEQNDWGDKNDAEGGGGGGGNGIPAGNGGGEGGQGGNLKSGGGGGSGGDDGEAEGGNGGNGGSGGGNGQGASGGNNKQEGNGSGGSGGTEIGYY
jgi:hypothetical protein|tara:strand:- start:444 stop:1319 length:876 start_codon:yes stop_codon:yes gene_type:complete